MNSLKKILLMIPLLLILNTGFGQNGNGEMADLMRSNGRIYVVVAVMLTILAGLVFYLVRLDKKISKLEKES